MLSFEFTGMNTQVTGSVHYDLSEKLSTYSFAVTRIDSSSLTRSPLFQFLNVPMFRNVTLKCLTEIAGVSVNQYEEQFVSLFTLTMCQLKQVLRHFQPQTQRESNDLSAKPFLSEPK